MKRYLIFLSLSALLLVTLVNLPVNAQNNNRDSSGSCCCFSIILIGIAAILSRFFVKSSSKEEPQTFTKKLIESGIISENEEVIEWGNYARIRELKDVTGKKHEGTIVLTNKKIMFLRGFSVYFFIPLDDILSVTTVEIDYALSTNEIKLSVQKSNTPEVLIIYCKNGGLFAKKIVDAKRNLVEKHTIKAKTVIIEEAKKDNAMEILQKRLARGEITKEEFHDKVQRL